MKRAYRRQLIINPLLQYKLMFLILASIIIPALLTFLTLYFLIHNILLEAQVNNETVYNALLFMSRHVYVVLFFGFITITVLLVMWSTIFMHRIVGPLYRLERELDSMIAGQPITKIQFRKNDSLHNIAGKINLLISALQQKS